MISDREIAALLVALYAYSDAAPVAWDHYDDGKDSDGVCWATKGGIVLLRGSTTLQDWLRDFDCWADPFHHDDLGPVHPGFLSGMRTVERELRDIGPVDVVAGHSLGAARAAILAALLMIDGRPPPAVVLFGSPRPGFIGLSQILAPLRIRSYRNGNGHGLGHDVVTDVPFSFPPQEYVQPRPFIDVTAIPGQSLRDSWGIFAYHHVSLYLGALS